VAPKAKPKPTIVVPSLGGSGYSTTTPGTVPPATAPVPGTATGVAENVVSLPADLANQILVGQGPGTPAVAAEPILGPQRQGADTAATARDLLTAYRDMFGTGNVTDQDIRVLASLQNMSGGGDLLKDAKTAQQEWANNTKGPGIGGPTTGNSVQGAMWHSLFGGGTVASFNLPEAKTILAEAIAFKVPGLDMGSILAHDPKDVLDIKVTPSMAANFEKEGYSVQANTPLLEAIDQINPAGFFAAHGKKPQETAAQPAKPPQTAQEWLTGAINDYQTALTESQTGKTAADKAAGAKAAAQIVTTLTDAGMLTTKSPTPTDIANAYTTLVTNAVNQKVTPASLLATGQASVQANNPNLTTANTSNQAAEIANTADRLGVQLTPAQMNYLTAQADAYQSSSGTIGWTQAQIDQAVSGYFTFPTTNGVPDPTKLSGDAASVYQGLKKIADSYQIPISANGPNGLASWVTSAISGINDSGQVDTTTALSSGAGAAEAAFTQYAQATAAGLYPQFATQIAKGIPTTTLLDPYAQVAASVLGFGNVAGTSASVSQASDATASLNIDWSNPKWSVALNGERDPTTGQPVPMTLDQWRSHLINDPQYGWAKTDDAKNLGMGVADHLLSVFGQPAATGQ
jgi:hypothetical protein